MWRPFLQPHPGNERIACLNSSCPFRAGRSCQGGSLAFPLPFLLFSQPPNTAPKREEPQEQNTSSTKCLPVKAQNNIVPFISFGRLKGPQLALLKLLKPGLYHQLHGKKYEISQHFECNCIVGNESFPNHSKGTTCVKMWVDV